VPTVAKSQLIHPVHSISPKRHISLLVAPKVSVSGQIKL